MDTRSWTSPSVHKEFARLKAGRPFCYGITNYVAATLSANVLLAVGAGVAIGTAEDWPGVFAGKANAVWINAAGLMTSDAQTLRLAARNAHEHGVPWVLDPVAVGAGAPDYDRVVRDLLTFQPTAIRGNASELVALAGGAGGGRGVDTTLSSDQALPFLQDLAARTGAVTAVSGPVDYITDGKTTLTVSGGDARLTQVTGAGCALGALMAALLAGADSALESVTAAHALYAEAAHRASTARGSASFALAFLDHLSLLEIADF